MSMNSEREFRTTRGPIEKVDVQEAYPADHLQRTEEDREYISYCVKNIDKTGAY